MEPANNKTDRAHHGPPDNEPRTVHGAAATTLRFVAALTAAYLIGHWLSSAFLGG